MVEFHYRDYVLHADRVTYDRSTSEVVAEGHVQVAGGPNDVLINATMGHVVEPATRDGLPGERVAGVKTAGRTVVYSRRIRSCFGRVLMSDGRRAATDHRRKR